jgi:hypothetical protein
MRECESIACSRVWIIVNVKMTISQVYRRQKSFIIDQLSNQMTIVRKCQPCRIVNIGLHKLNFSACCQDSKFMKPRDKTVASSKNNVWRKYRRDHESQRQNPWREQKSTFMKIKVWPRLDRAGVAGHVTVTETFVLVTDCRQFNLDYFIFHRRHVYVYSP